MNNQEKFKPEFSTCSGPSMYPTLRGGDGLVLKKYKSNADLKIGDIIVYPHPEPNKNFDVVHRIIKLTEKGVVTRGDNNNKIDPYLVVYENISGWVYAAKRKNKTIYLLNGKKGYILHRLMLFRKYVVYPMIKPLRLLSALIASSKILNIFHSQIKTKIVTLTKNNKKELLLLYKGKVIGRKKSIVDSNWKIKFPYKFFIDKEKL
jgi:signal peptidase I